MNSIIVSETKNFSNKLFKDFVVLFLKETGNFLIRLSEKIEAM